MGRDVLALSKDLNIGAATFRKTGYLFGVFGGGKFEDLMDSARHKSIVNAKSTARMPKASTKDTLQPALTTTKLVNSGLPEWSLLGTQKGLALRG